MTCKYYDICELYAPENKSCNPADGEKPYCDEFRKYDRMSNNFIGRFLISRLRKSNKKLESKL